jgi:hypothetical protein
MNRLLTEKTFSESFFSARNYLSFLLSGKFSISFSSPGFATRIAPRPNCASPELRLARIAPREYASFSLRSRGLI